MSTLNLMARITFSVQEPYHHWILTMEGSIAWLTMAVSDDAALEEGYDLKLNSYDLSVDIELANIMTCIRFEYPDIRTVIIGGNDAERVFCAGANIYMLARADHGFKVNFCKFTNETRLAIEDASDSSGLRFLAACNGTTAGGGYELALACDYIALVDDGSSAVSFPETPLLAVLPGTGGLTRLVDKRKVRRDLADVFSTLAEGVKGRRAVAWGLVDELVPRSTFRDKIKARAEALSEEVADIPKGPAVTLEPIVPNITDTGYEYQFVSLEIDTPARTATLTVKAPSISPPQEIDEIVSQGSNLWNLHAFQELDDALLQLRFNEPEIGLVIIRTSGDAKHVLAADQCLKKHANIGFIREVQLLQSRVLRRMDLSSKSFFAVIDAQSCFAGTLFELALASDRIYMLDEEPVSVWLSSANDNIHPMSNGLSRLQSRFLATPSQVNVVLAQEGAIDTPTAEKLGLTTLIADDVDFEDELRIAMEERTSMSPDALIGMEASLRFAGPETMATKIFGRLSAWQNWIFTRPNATGEHGALSLYGKPERPRFRWNRS